MGQDRQVSSDAEVIAYKRPITGDPWFPDSVEELEQKSGGTAEGPSGVTYHTVRMWPVEWREAAYRCMVSLWTHHGLAKE